MVFVSWSKHAWIMVEVGENVPLSYEMACEPAVKHAMVGLAVSKSARHEAERLSIDVYKRAVTKKLVRSAVTPWGCDVCLRDVDNCLRVQKIANRKVKRCLTHV